MKNKYNIQAKLEHAHCICDEFAIKDSESPKKNVHFEWQEDECKINETQLLLSGLSKSDSSPVIQFYLDYCTDATSCTCSLGEAITRTYYTSNINVATRKRYLIYIAKAVYLGVQINLGSSDFEIPKSLRRTIYAQILAFPITHLPQNILYNYCEALYPEESLIVSDCHQSLNNCITAVRSTFGKFPPAIKSNNKAIEQCLSYASFPTVLPPPIAPTPEGLSSFLFASLGLEGDIFVTNLFQLGAGARFSEVFMLRNRDIQFSTTSPTAHFIKGDGFTTKTKLSRSAAIPIELYNKFRAPHAPISSLNNLILPVSRRKIFSLREESANFIEQFDLNIEYGKTHFLRRIYTTYMLKKDWNPRKVADFLGHAGLNVIQSHYYLRKWTDEHTKIMDDFWHAVGISFAN